MFKTQFRSDCFIWFAISIKKYVLFSPLIGILIEIFILDMIVWLKIESIKWDSSCNLDKISEFLCSTFYARSAFSGEKKRKRFLAVILIYKRENKNQLSLIRIFLHRFLNKMRLYRDLRAKKILSVEINKLFGHLEIFNALLYYDIKF